MTETTSEQYAWKTLTAGLCQVMRSTGYAFMAFINLISMTSSPHGIQFERNALLGPLTGVRGVKREKVSVRQARRAIFFCALLASFADCTTDPNKRPPKRLWAAQAR